MLLSLPAGFGLRSEKNSLINQILNLKQSGGELRPKLKLN